MFSTRAASGPRPLLLLRLLLLSLGLVAASSAWSDPGPGEPRDSIVWNNPAGGDWNNAANWTPANVPDTPSEAAVLKPLSGGYVVTLSATYTVGGLLVQAGDAGLNVNGATLQINGIPRNRGTIRIAGGGTLRCYYPLFQNWGGSVVGGAGGGNFTVCGPYVESPGTLDNSLDGRMSTNGGTLVSDGGDLTVFCGALLNGEVQRISGTKAVKVTYATPQNLTVAAGAELSVTGQIDLMADGSSLLNHGVVRVGGRINVGGTANCSVSLAGDGEIVLEDGILDTPAGATLINTEGHTISGCGTVLANLVNYGEININCPFSYFRVPSPLRNYNRIRVESGLLWIKGGVTQFMNAATLSVGPGGALWIDEGASLNNVGGVLTADGGAIDLGRNTSCTIVGGQLDGTTGGVFDGYGATTLRDVTLGSGAELRTMAGATTTAIGARLVNQGTVRVAAQGTFAVGASTDYIQTSGATVLEGGLLTASRELQIQGGALRGIGTVTANVANGGDVSPPAGSGALAIHGDYRQLAGAHLNVELAGAGANQVSHLAVSGNAALDGAIEATTIGGYDPAPGSHFDVLSYGSVSGQFSEVVGTNLPGQVVPLYDDDGLALSVAAIVGVGDRAPTPAVLRFFGQAGAAKASFVLELPRDAEVSVRVYDATGREVAALAEGSRPAGIHSFSLRGTNGTGLPSSGVYFARAQVRSGGQLETRTARIAFVR